MWEKAVKLATIVYKAIDDFPKTEQYGLTNQIRINEKLIEIQKMIYS